MKYVQKLNEEQKEVKITLTHVFSHALAWGLYKVRRDIGRMPLGFFRHNKQIGLTVLCDVEGGSDLVPITLFDIHKGSIIDFARQCNERVGKAKNKQDEGHNKSTASANFLPSCVLQPILNFLSYVSVYFDVTIPGVVKKGSAGHYVLTNVGSLGMQQAVAPICPPLRPMGLICLGKSRKQPLVVDGEIKI